MNKDKQKKKGEEGHGGRLGVLLIVVGIIVFASACTSTALSVFYGLGEDTELELHEEAQDFLFELRSYHGLQVQGKPPGFWEASSVLRVTPQDLQLEFVPSFSFMIEIIDSDPEDTGYSRSQDGGNPISTEEMPEDPQEGPVICYTAVNIQVSIGEVHGASVILTVWND